MSVGGIPHTLLVGEYPARPMAAIGAADVEAAVRFW